MIVGVGIDVVDVARFGETLQRTPRLRDRLFTAEPSSGCALASLAARFAAKEAVAKALGAPVGLHWTDAWVVTGDDGRPHLEVAGTVAGRAGAARRHHLARVAEPRRGHRLGRGRRRAGGLREGRDTGWLDRCAHRRGRGAGAHPRGRADAARGHGGLAAVCGLRLPGT